MHAPILIAVLALRLLPARGASSAQGTMRVYRPPMVRCQAKDHPDCWHECEQGTCVAFFERETHMCFRGCNGALLGAGLVASVARFGWDARTSAEVRDISFAHIALAVQQVRALGRASDEVGLPEPIEKLLTTIEHVTRPSAAPPVWMWAGAVDAPHTTFAWSFGPIAHALEAILNAVGGAEPQAPPRRTAR